MSDNKSNHPENKKTEKQHSEGRREALKTIATIPVLGAMAYGVYQKKKNEHYNKVAGSIFNIESKPAVWMCRLTGKYLELVS